jgi:hypothetical protein
MLHAINAAARMGCNRVILETDSTVLKLAVSTEDYNLASLGALFQEIKFQLKIAFDVVKLYACSRSCNMAAHNLASYGVG